LDVSANEIGCPLFSPLYQLDRAHASETPGMNASRRAAKPRSNSVRGVASRLCGGDNILSEYGKIALHLHDT
jgi:hypothetical protein